MALVTLQGALGASDALVQQFLTATYPAVASMFSTPFYLLAILYWVWWALAIAGGRIPFAWDDFAKKAFMTWAVFATLNWAGFASKLYNAFYSFTEALAATIMTGQPTATMLDGLYRSVDNISATLRTANWMQWAIIIDGVLLLIVNTILMVIAYCYMAISKYGMGITMVFLPVFAGFAFFEESRGWVKSWFSKMLTFSLMYVLVVAIVRMGFFTYADAINEAKSLGGGLLNVAAISSQLVGQMLVVEAILIVFMLGVRGWASSLGGAAASNSGALVMIVRAAARSLRGGK